MRSASVFVCLNFKFRFIARTECVVGAQGSLV